MPADVGAAPGPSIPETPSPTEAGRQRSTAARPLGAVRRVHCPGGHRKGIYAAGVGPGGRRSREPPVAREGRTLSLSRVPRAVRREPALLGALSRSGTGLSALELAGLEDAGPGCLDRLE